MENRDLTPTDSTASAAIDDAGTYDGCKCLQVHRKSRSDPYCWVTVNPIPAMVSVAVRVAPVAFGSTLNWTVPAPEPDAPSVIVTHDAPLTAVHGQPVDAATDTDPTPPVAGIICDVDPRLYVQPLS